MHDFGRKFDISLPSLFLAKFKTKVFGNVLDRQRAFLDEKNIDIRKLQNLHFLKRG